MDERAVVEAAFVVLGREGLDGLSMRAVAQHLGVRVGGLYYHVRDKDALLRAMADDLARRVDEPVVTGDPFRDAATWCGALRRTVTACRDGARILAASPHLGSPGALALMEHLQSRLAAALPSAERAACADTLLCYVAGFVAQEQRPLAVDVGGHAPALLAQFPLVAESVRNAGHSDDALFGSCVEAILRGFGLTPAPTPPFTQPAASP